MVLSDSDRHKATGDGNRLLDQQLRSLADDMEDIERSLSAKPPMVLIDSWSWQGGRCHAR